MLESIGRNNVTSHVSIMAQQDPAHFIECVVGEIVKCSTVGGSKNIYACEVDIGSNRTRHVLTSGRQFYTVDEMSGKKVCVFINCQPAELFDQISEGIMLGCATDPKHVELLEPPLEASAGDRIYFGSNSSDEEGLEMDQNNRYWKKMQSSLQIDSQGNATYKGEEIYTDYGAVTAPNLRNCPFH
jgi:tRNA-binding EMAP/Myf-like protein